MDTNKQTNDITNIFEEVVNTLKEANKTFIPCDDNETYAEARERLMCHLATEVVANNIMPIVHNNIITQPIPFKNDFPAAEELDTIDKIHSYAAKMGLGHHFGIDPIDAQQIVAGADGCDNPDDPTTNDLNEYEVVENSEAEISNPDDVKNIEMKHMRIILNEACELSNDCLDDESKHYYGSNIEGFYNELFESEHQKIINFETFGDYNFYIRNLINDIVIKFSDEIAEDGGDTPIILEDIRDLIYKIKGNAPVLTSCIKLYLEHEKNPIDGYSLKPLYSVMIGNIILNTIDKCSCWQS